MIQCFQRVLDIQLAPLHHGEGNQYRAHLGLLARQGLDTGAPCQAPARGRGVLITSTRRISPPPPPRPPPPPHPPHHHPLPPNPPPPPPPPPPAPPPPPPAAPHTFLPPNRPTPPPPAPSPAPPPSTPRVCMSNQLERKLRGHVRSRFDSVFSMTLLPDHRHVRRGGVRRHGLRAGRCQEARHVPHHRLGGLLAQH